MVTSELTDNSTDSTLLPVATDSDLTRALKQMKANAERYHTCDQYYRGVHQLCFATDKFKNAFGDLFRAFADNLCPAVCDAVTDNLQVTGFGVESGTAETANKAWELWQENRMDQRAGEVHLEAVRAGDSYVIVWPDADGKPIIYPQDAQACTVGYDVEQPGKVLWGAKFWRLVDKTIRANLYYADRIEKYITRATSPNGLPDKDQAFIKFEVEGEAWPLSHDYGAVPLFHFANNASVGQMGNSELVAVVPLQDALNKAVLDMMVAMEFAAFRQRWATGIEVTLGEDGKPIAPFVPGVERLWTTDSENAKFGEFNPSELKQFLDVQNDFRLEIARVSATPLHYLNLQDGQVPSGEALKTLEKRHVRKVKDRMTTFGNVWEDVMNFALKIASVEETRLSTEWADPFGPSDMEKLNVLQAKKVIGIPEEQLWEEAGYAESDITKMAQMNADKREQARRDFNAL